MEKGMDTKISQRTYLSNKFEKITKEVKKFEHDGLKWLVMGEA